MSDVVPRLWPFLCHSTSSVRRATLQTLRTLTACRTGQHRAGAGKQDGARMDGAKGDVDDGVKESHLEEDGVKKQDGVTEDGAKEDVSKEGGVTNQDCATIAGAKEDGGKENHTKAGGAPDDCVAKEYIAKEHGTTEGVKEDETTKQDVTTGGTAEVDGAAGWGPELLQDALRHLFQRALVEPMGEIQDIVEQVRASLDLIS